MKKIWEEESLKKIYNQVKDLKMELLLSGLAILVKDTADFINTNGFKDEATEKFMESYLAMLNHDRYYWQQFGPELYMTLSDAGLPSGFVKEAYRGKFDLDKLKDESIIKEWTQFPGYYFFKIYTENNKNLILSGTDLNQEKAKVFECKQPEEQIFPLVEKLSKQSKFGLGYWYPLTLYIVMILIRSRFTTLEQSDEVSKQDSQLENLENKFSAFEQRLSALEQKLENSDIQSDNLKVSSPPSKKIILPKGSK